MRKAVFFGLIVGLWSCSSSPEVVEYETPLLDTSARQQEVVLKEQELELKYAVLMRETWLLQKPEKWSKSNRSVNTSYLPVGTQVQILDTLEKEKKRYLKLSFGEVEGWTSSWKIIEDATSAMSLGDILLFKRPDITSYTQQQVKLGDLFSMTTENESDFRQISFIDSNNVFGKYWVKAKDLKSITTDRVDFKLYKYYQQLQDSTHSIDDVMAQVELTKTDTTSLIYLLIQEKYGINDSVDVYLNQLIDQDTLYEDDVF
jgi:hypothetical protein